MKNLLAMQETQETQVLSLHQEDPLEKEMATHSSILFFFSFDIIVKFIFKASRSLN